ncbi:MAG: hypothetical protein WCK90_01870 [archaeon]
MTPPMHNYKRYRARMPFNHRKMIEATQAILADYPRPKELTAYFALPESFRETDKALRKEIEERTGIKLIYPFDYDPNGGMRPDAVPFDEEKVLSSHMLIRHIPNASIGATHETATATYFQKPVLVYASGERFFSYPWVLEYASNVDSSKELWIRKIHAAKIMYDKLDKDEKSWNPKFRDFINHYRTRIDGGEGDAPHLEKLIDHFLLKK